jgi:predicted nucleic-acid-binding Zn-ribbon protein
MGKSIDPDKLDLPQWGRIDDSVLVVLCKQCGYRDLFYKENDQIPGRCEKCGYDGTEETELPY